MRFKLQIGVTLIAISFLTGTVLGQNAIQEAAKQPSPAPSSAPAAEHAATGTPTNASKPGTPPRLRAVPILISVTDSSGSPVTSLTKEQLSLTDTSQAVQPLNIYKAHDVPLHLGILLLSAPATFSQQQAAAASLVQRVVRPNMDEAFVVKARGKKAWSGDRLDWAQDPAQLAKTIQGLDRDAGLPDAFNFEMKTDSTSFDENGGRNTLQYFGGSGVNIFSVAYSMMNSEPRPARRVLVIFREAWSHSPGFGNRANGAVESTLIRVIAQAQQLHITSFVIGLEDPKFNGITDNTIGQNYISLHAGDDGGAGSASRSYDQEMERERRQAYNAGKSNVDRLAAETGGISIWSVKKNYPDAVNAIANQIEGQYIVTFVPGDIAGPEHALRVSSNGVRVLAQKSFFFSPQKQ